MERKKIEAKILVSEAVKRVNDEDEDAEKSNSEQGLPDDNDDFEQEQEVITYSIILLINCFFYKFLNIFLILLVYLSKILFIYNLNNSWNFGKSEN